MENDKPTEPRAGAGLQIVPAPYLATLTQTPSGRVVLRQFDQLIVIPPEHLRQTALALAACVRQLVPGT